MTSWTCRRVLGGVKCGATNPTRLRKCRACGKHRPKRKRPAALQLTYEQYIELNGGEHCGICGRKPSPNRRLDRDHDHGPSGKPRGLLCWRCNSQLRTWMTIEWLSAASAYLERTK